MKKFSLLPLAVALSLVVSCEKPMSEADKNAQIEREVQQRLAAERQAADQLQLTQQQAELAAREQALAEKEAAAARDAVAAATPRPVARAEESDERSASSSDSRSPRSYDTFYRKLEPYGSWRETGDYGYVWQPREAQSRNWRPYTDGRWAYTDAGWTWVSNESHGWATYHYGRWTRLRGVGWVWVPGEDWAPAWVSWRSSDQHVGWAPLPPEAKFERRTGIKKWADNYYDIDADEYVFIPNEEIGSENVERAVVPVERNVTIVNETTNVTNITYVNTTIVSEGPNYDALRGRSRRPLERLRLERRYNVEEDQAPQPAVRGNVLAIMTPLFTAQAVERPRNVGAPITQVTVERASAANANQAEVQRARAKMRAEATPPPDAPAKKFEKPAVVAGTPTPAVAATAAPTAVATVAPRATPTPMASAAPSLRPFPTASSIPSAPPTPRSVPTITPKSVATPIPTAKPSSTPTPKPVASATPVATPTPTARPLTTPTPKPIPSATPVATPTPTAKPLPTPTPKPIPLATPIATPSARPVITPPPSVSKPTAPALVPKATVATTPGAPIPKATTRPPGKPAPVGTDPYESAPVDPNASSEKARGRDPRPSQGADKSEKAPPVPTIAPVASAIPAAPRGVTPRTIAVPSPVTSLPGAAKVPQEPPANLQDRSRTALPPTAPVAPALATPPAVPIKKVPVVPATSPTPTPTPTPGAKS